MRVTANSLVSEIIERLEGEPVERGRPRLPVSDVVATLQFFLREGIQPRIRKIDSEHGSSLGVIRSVVENANAWILNNKRLDRRHDRSAGIVQSLLITALIFVIANRLADL